eukprot:TRINITY_DN370_c0_g1_i1.p1 TRINITY_DN370_c0_g1~~TRINITY_DN370_c0_g1_i1.p1  ORF type:complete len:1394 (+),score=494.08 TRINITY_DN370_c0_g1_i1:29-4183(+)
MNFDNQPSPKSEKESKSNNSEEYETDEDEDEYDEDEYYDEEEDIEYQNLVSENEEMKEEISRLQKVFKDVEKQNTVLSEENSRLSIRLERIDDERKAQALRQKKEINDLQSQKERLIQEKESLMGRLTSAGDSATEFNQKVRNQTSTISNLETQVDALEAQNKLLRKSIGDERKRFDTLEVEKKFNENQLNEVNTLLKSVKAQLSRATNRIAELEEKEAASNSNRLKLLSEQDKIVKSLREEINDLNKTINKKKEQEIMLLKRIDEYQRNFKDVKEGLDQMYSLKQLISNQQSELIDREEQIEELMEEVERLRLEPTEINDLIMNQREELRLKTIDYEMELDSWKFKYESSELARDSLQEQLQKRESELNAYEVKFKKLASGKIEIADLLQEIEEKDNIVANRDREIHILRQQLNDFQNRLSMIGKELLLLRKRAQDHGINISDIKVDNLEDLLGIEQRNLLEQIRFENIALEKEISSLEEEKSRYRRRARGLYAAALQLAKHTSFVGEDLQTIFETLEVLGTSDNDIETSKAGDGIHNLLAKLGESDKNVDVSNVSQIEVMYLSQQMKDKDVAIDSLKEELKEMKTLLNETQIDLEEKVILLKETKQSKEYVLIEKLKDSPFFADLKIDPVSLMFLGKKLVESYENINKLNDYCKNLEEKVLSSSKDKEKLVSEIIFLSSKLHSKFSNEIFNSLKKIQVEINSNEDEPLLKFDFYNNDVETQNARIKQLETDNKDLSQLLHDERIEKQKFKEMYSIIHESVGDNSIVTTLADIRGKNIELKDSLEQKEMELLHYMKLSNDLNKSLREVEIYLKSRLIYYQTRSEKLFEMIILEDTNILKLDEICKIKEKNSKLVTLQIQNNEIIKSLQEVIRNYDDGKMKKRGQNHEFLAQMSLDNALNRANLLAELSSLKNTSHQQFVELKRFYSLLSTNGTLSKDLLKKLKALGNNERPAILDIAENASEHLANFVEANVENQRLKEDIISKDKLIKALKNQNMETKLELSQINLEHQKLKSEMSQSTLINSVIPYSTMVHSQEDYENKITRLVETIERKDGEINRKILAIERYQELLKKAREDQEKHAKTDSKIRQAMLKQLDKYEKQRTKDLIKTNGEIALNETNQIIIQLESEKAALLRDKQVYINTNESLANKMKKMKQIMKVLKREISIKERKVLELENINPNEQLQLLNEELKSELRKSKSLISSLQKESITRGNSMKSVGLSLAETEMKLATITDALNQKTVEIEELQKSNAYLNNLLTDINQRFSRVRGEKELLEKKLAGSNANVSNMNVSETIDDDQENLAFYDNNALRKFINKLRKKLRRSEQNRIHLGDKLNDKANQIMELENNIDELLKEVGSLEAERDNLLSRVHKLISSKAKPVIKE